MMYERSQQIGTLTQVAEFSRETAAKFPDVVGGVIGEAGVFEVRPDLFIRVEFRSISRKFLGDNFGMFGQIRLHQLGTIMHSAAIPDNRDRSGKMALKLTQEADHILGMHIFVIIEQSKVQPPCLRIGLMVMALIAEMRSRLSQQR